jgi:IS30 family transposase
MEFKIRDRSVNLYGRRLVRERAAYLALVDQGASSREACGIVGVNHRTGKRWRNGRNPSTRGQGCHEPGAAPISPQPVEVASSRYLTEDERIHIADRLREKASRRQIARELGRDAATISREITRNSHPVSGIYRPHAAQRRAQARRPRPKPRKITADPRLRETVQSYLDQKWSPEQIAAQLRHEFPDRPEMHVAHETIYQTLYLQAQGGLRREVAAALRTGRAIRKPRWQTQQHRGQFRSPMLMISQRPAEADDRAVPGHWEGDLIIGKDNGSAIGTVVERSTRYVLLVALPHGRTAETFRDALTATIQTLPAHLRRSLTWDQGREMGGHAEFSLATDMPVYFCDPASPWQRGSNENTNGLLRQYFPKGTDLSLHTPQHLAAVAAELNGRPRKTLDWDTPAQRLAKVLAANN